MANNFGKILDKIGADNTQLNENHEQLAEALDKLDARLNVLRARVRIEPYPINKDGPTIGFRRFHDGWHITTLLEGLAGITSEIPIREAAPGVQVNLIGAIGALLEKISKSIEAEVKASTASVKEAEVLLDALP